MDPTPLHKLIESWSATAAYLGGLGVLVYIGFRWGTLLEMVRAISAKLSTVCESLTTFKAENGADHQRLNERDDVSTADRAKMHADIREIKTKVDTLCPR